jgi:hypothetical protein
VLGHRVLDRFALADEIKHHHRVREQRHQRGEDAVRDVARDVGAAKTEHGRRDETGKADEYCGEERLSHDEVPGLCHLHPSSSNGPAFARTN